MIAWLHSDWDVNPYRREHDLYGGIGYYRVIKPAQVLKKHFDIEVIGADFQKWGVEGMPGTKYQRFEQYDLIISRPGRTPKEASDLFATAKHFKKKLILDVDDNFYALRPDNPAYKDYEYGQGPAEYLGAMISLADSVMVSTAPLKKAYKTLNKKIDVLPNCNDVNDWPTPKDWNDGKVRIGFAGGQGHLADLNLILEPMAYILAKYPHVLFEIVGTITPDQAMLFTLRMNEYCKKNISAQVRLAGGTQAWQGYPEMMANMGWDIVLAPLVDDTFNQCKSHIRWMEASMLKCPVVASPVYPYIEKIYNLDTILHDKTGLFARTSEDWFKYLSELVESKSKRQEIANDAFNYIKDNWQYNHHVDRWKKVINKYI